MDPPIEADEPPPPKSPIRNTNSVDQNLQVEAAVSSGNADENGDGEKSLDALAKGISSLLTNAFTDFDSKASRTFKSQDNLIFAIDRLTKELDQLLEDAPVHFIMQNAAKISAVRKRVASLNSVLRSIQRRLDNIDRTLTASQSSQDKAKTESAAEK